MCYNPNGRTGYSFHADLYRARITDRLVNRVHNLLEHVLDSASLHVG